MLVGYLIFVETKKKEKRIVFVLHAELNTETFLINKYLQSIIWNRIHLHCTFDFDHIGLLQHTVQ